MSEELEEYDEYAEICTFLSRIENTIDSDKMEKIPAYRMLKQYAEGMMTGEIVVTSKEDALEFAKIGIQERIKPSVEKIEAAISNYYIGNQLSVKAVVVTAIEREALRDLYTAAGWTVFISESQITLK